MAQEFELGLLALLGHLAGGMMEETLFIECPCGAKLERSTPRRAYGIATGIRCDGCLQGIGAMDSCFHCPRGRTLIHNSGYDLCDNCGPKKAEEQAKKDEVNAPKLPDPLKFVRCRCGDRMEFIPARLKYRAACKCDECGDAVPRLSYIYHCPKDRSDEHHTAHRLFDYCFACAYKKNPTLANGSDSNVPQIIFQMRINNTEEEGNSQETETGGTETNTTANTNNKQGGGEEENAQLELLKRKLQMRMQQIQNLENELQTLREAARQATELAEERSKNNQQEQKSNENKENESKSSQTGILDAILKSELPRLGLPNDRDTAGNRVNEITVELLKLATLQSAALQWLSNGEMNPNKTENSESHSRGIWNHVSLTSLQTMYGKLDLLFKQYDEMSSQVSVLRTSCLEHISKKQDDWENWTADEVVDWISAIESGRFLKYDAQLRQVLNERGFKGKHIRTLKFDRITALGVKDYDDADALMNCVEMLISSNNTGNREGV